MNAREKVTFFQLNVYKRSSFSVKMFFLSYLSTTHNTKQLQVLLTIRQFTSPTLQINVITYSTYSPIYTLLTKIIQYLHPYCNNEQQNKENLITYQNNDTDLCTTCNNYAP